MLITYEKYNTEIEEVGVAQAINHDGDLVVQSDEIFNQPSEPPFKEIELMRELVLEIGSAIDERIKEDAGASPSPRKDSNVAALEDP